MTERKTPFTRSDLSAEIKTTALSGAALVPSLLTKETISGLQLACSSLEYTLLDEHHSSGVSRRYFVPKAIPLHVQEKVTELEESFEIAIKKEGGKFRELATWKPNEYSIQRYDQKSYITPHHDSIAYRGVVVLANIQGETHFKIKKRHEEGLTSWDLKEGDVVLLRATGLNQQEHIGIPHAVSGANSGTPRISIGFRKKH